MLSHSALHMLHGTHDHIEVQLYLQHLQKYVSDTIESLLLLYHTYLAANCKLAIKPPSRPLLHNTYLVLKCS